MPILVWCENPLHRIRTGASFCRCYPREVSANCWPITVRHPSTGRRIRWTTRPLPASSSSCRTCWQRLFITPRAITACVVHDARPRAYAYAQGEGMKHHVEKRSTTRVRRGERWLHLFPPAEVGTGYFDKVTTIIQGASSVTALTGSTEESQFLIDARWRCAITGPGYR